MEGSKHGSKENFPLATNFKLQPTNLNTLRSNDEHSVDSNTGKKMTIKRVMISPEATSGKEMVN